MTRNKGDIFKYQFQIGTHQYTIPHQPIISTMVGFSKAEILSRLILIYAANPKIATKYSHVPLMM